MGCSQGNYARYVGTCGTTANAPTNLAVSPPFLVVSNCPESVNSQAMMTPPPNSVSTSTLYRCVINLPADTTRIRVFVWHVNQLGPDRIYSLFGRVETGSAQIQDRRIVSLRSSDYPATGLCLAKVHLWDEWDAPLSNQTLGQAETAIWQQTQVGNNQLIGAVMEFDLVLTAAATLCLRTTVATGTGAPGAWNQTPAIDPLVHVRGWWPFSELTMSGGSFDAKALEGDPPAQITECVTRDGPENTAFATTQDDEFGTDDGRGNRGCYGANLYYDFAVSNSGDQGYPMYAYAQSRNISTQTNRLGYFGPCSILSPGNYPKLGITQLRCDGANPNPGDYVRLTTTDGSNEVYVVIQPGETPTYRVGAAVAGSAGAPFNLVFRGIGYVLSTPPEV